MFHAQKFTRIWLNEGLAKLIIILSTKPSLRCPLVLVWALHDICLQFFLLYLSWTSGRGHVGDSTVCLEPVLMGQNKLTVSWCLKWLVYQCKN